MISIHAPTRGATYKDIKSDYIVNISIHAPTRGATCYRVWCQRFSLYFNPRSHEGSDQMSVGGYLIIGNFNPRSHEGSDRVFFCQLPNLVISIHAPTRGATVFKPSPGESTQNDFNPRSHEGSDVARKSTAPYANYISIHAPTRGAT